MTESTRGILSDADRDFLLMDREERREEYTRSAISQRWSTIRRRVYLGLCDLERIFHHLPDKERQDVFNQFEAAGIILHKRSQLLRYSVALLFLGVIEQENFDFDDEDYYEHMFYHIIETVLNKIGFGAEEIDVDVTIEGWHHPNEGLAASDLTELDEEGLRHLLFDGQITSEEFAHGILDRDKE